MRRIIGVVVAALCLLVQSALPASAAWSVKLISDDGPSPTSSLVLSSSGRCVRRLAAEGIGRPLLGQDVRVRLDLHDRGRPGRLLRVLLEQLRRDRSFRGPPSGWHARDRQRVRLRERRRERHVHETHREDVEDNRGGDGSFRRLPDVAHGRGPHQQPDDRAPGHRDDEPMHG